MNYLAVSNTIVFNGPYITMTLVVVLEQEDKRTAVNIHHIEYIGACNDIIIDNQTQ